jgi:hypothetical protein
MVELGNGLSGVDIAAAHIDSTARDQVGDPAPVVAACGSPPLWSGLGVVGLGLGVRAWLSC